MKMLNYCGYSASTYWYSPVVFKFSILSIYNFVYKTSSKLFQIKEY